MHCANLDTLVKGTSPLHQSPPQTKNMETREEEDARMLRMVLDAGILILEGRLPDRTSKRGYVEGPHCVLHPRTQTHRCDFNNYLCKRAEKYRQLMKSMWNDFKGLCIELRACADCSCGEEQVWKNAASRYDHVLEQWYFEITNFRNDEDGIGVMNWYGLLQAIRSQIHFSQLSAWWCSNRAQLPKNITYHVLPLMQADANSCPLQHKFPVLAFSTTYLQVKVRSQPRSEVLPKIHCPVHCNQDVLDDRMRICCDRFGKHHCQAVEDLDENENETWYDDKNQFRDGILEPNEACLRQMASIDVSCKDKNVVPLMTMKNRCGGNAAIDARRNGRCPSNAHILTFRRPPCAVTPNPNRISSQKVVAVELSSSPRRHEDVVGKCKLNSSVSTLSEETNTQFLNVCNWTNSVMSNVMSKVCTSNGFLNNLADSYSFADFIHNKLDSKTTADGAPRTKLAGRDLSDGDVNFEDRRPMDRKCFANAKNTDTIANSCSDVSKAKTLYPVPVTAVKMSVPSDLHAKVDMNCEGKTLMNGAVKETAAVEKILGRVRSFNEKRSRFERSRKRLLPFAGNVIESVLSGRVYFARAIENFKIKITCGGTSVMQNNCTELPAATYYYHFGDGDLSKSYLVKSCILEKEKGIQIPASGQLQLGVFNTEESLVKVFALSYDLSDMPRCTKTYIRHSNYFIPKCSPDYNFKWLQSFLRLKCSCSKSGRLYLQNEINVIIFQKSDLNTAFEIKTKNDLKHHDVTEIEYKEKQPEIVNNKF